MTGSIYVCIVMCVGTSKALLQPLSGVLVLSNQSIYCQSVINKVSLVDQ